MICMLGNSSDLVLVAVRQHGQEARALDGNRQLTVEEWGGARQASRRDLAVFADEITQRVDVLVVDLLDTGDGEAAETLATEQQRLLVALGLLVFGEAAFTTWRGHSEPLLISIRSRTIQVRVGSRAVTWKIVPRPLRWLLRKPVNKAELPTPRACSRLPISPIATALISMETLRGLPASCTWDSCFKLKSRAIKPAGVYRTNPSSSSCACKIS